MTRGNLWKEAWEEAKAAAARVPGFEARPSRREFRLKCVDKACTWTSQNDTYGGRWVTQSRRHARQLVRFAWAHANKHHPNVPPRPSPKDAPHDFEERISEYLRDEAAIHLTSRTETDGGSAA